MTDVSVIGLGQMGAAVAALLLGSGKSVTVWNRSVDKSLALVAAGAAAAASPGAAVAASPLVLSILSDHRALNEVLGYGDVERLVQGRTVVDLGTAGPEEARAMAERLSQLGAHYLDGAIQAAPAQMGQADTPILISGPQAAFDAATPTLRLLGGGLVWLGEPIDGAANMDLATLSYVYGAFGGFLHGARIAETSGLDVERFGRIVQSISPSFGAFFAHEAKVIASGDFAVTESPLRISIPAVDRIVAASETLGINTELPSLLQSWLAEAQDMSLADQELAALVHVLRRRGGG